MRHALIQIHTNTRMHNQMKSEMQRLTTKFLKLICGVPQRI